MSSLIAPQFSIVSRRTVRGAPQNCRESAFFFCVRHCEFIGFASRGILSSWMVLLLPRSCCRITAYEYLLTLRVF